MRKLTYWIAGCLSDSVAYSIRRKTRKEVLDELKKLGAVRGKNGDGDPIWRTEHGNRFSMVRKVTVEYENPFDLLQQALGEGGIYEGPQE